MDDVTVAHLFAGAIGLGLLRHWYEDGTTNEARIAELNEVVAGREDEMLAVVLNPSERALLDGYAEWAPSYDGTNPMIDAEERAIVPILASLSGGSGDALDAACGTGRHTARLDALGWNTTGVDQSAEMLARARAKVPRARFEIGDVRTLPLADESFDLAIVALALCHLDDPADAVINLARVLRPGGVLVVTDPHPFSGVIGGQAFYGAIGTGPMTWVRNHPHGASTWLRAFRAAGLVVEHCEEPPYDQPQIEASPLYPRYPEAAWAALGGLPSLWVWVVRKPVA